jgi:hypothetical protein
MKLTLNHDLTNLGITVQQNNSLSVINFAEMGTQGASAYQVASLNGFVGTEAEWLNSLKSEIYERFDLISEINQTIFNLNITFKSVFSFYRNGVFLDKNTFYKQNNTVVYVPSENDNLSLKNGEEIVIIILK